MSDVFPVFAKRWYGYGPDDWYWQMFCIVGTQEDAERTVREGEATRRPSRARRGSPFEEGRKAEFKYQRNMVL